ncbi:hypothetical protein Leryth_022085, partial [Lithospermum erythrorhizon]
MEWSLNLVRTLYNPETDGQASISEGKGLRIITLASTLKRVLISSSFFDQ